MEKCEIKNGFVTTGESVCCLLLVYLGFILLLCCFFKNLILRTNKQNDSPLEVSRSVIHPFKRVELAQWGKCYRKLMYMIIKSVCSHAYFVKQKSCF